MKLENIAPYFNTINTLDDKSYIMMLIAYNASPTIARLKSSSLMVFRSDTDRDLYFIWEKYKAKIKFANYVVEKTQRDSFFALL